MNKPKQLGHQTGMQIEAIRINLLLITKTVWKYDFYHYGHKVYSIMWGSLHYFLESSKLMVKQWQRSRCKCFLMYPSINWKLIKKVDVRVTKEFKVDGTEADQFLWSFEAMLSIKGSPPPSSQGLFTAVLWKWHLHFFKSGSGVHFS